MKKSILIMPFFLAALSTPVSSDEMTDIYEIEADAYASMIEMERYRADEGLFPKSIKELRDLYVKKTIKLTLNNRFMNIASNRKKRFDGSIIAGPIPKKCKPGMLYVDLRLSGNYARIQGCATYGKPLLQGRLMIGKSRFLRGKDSSIKAMMHLFQTSLEAYNVNNSGVYPESISEVARDSYSRKYIHNIRGASGVRWSSSNPSAEGIITKGKLNYNLKCKSGLIYYFVSKDRKNYKISGCSLIGLPLAERGKAIELYNS